MKKSWRTALLVLAMTCGGGTSSPPQPEASVPANLSEAVEALGREVNASTKSRMRSFDEAEMIQYHDTLGRWIRNHWLRGPSPFRLYFEDLGLTSRDGMSHLVLKAFWRELNERPMDLESLVEEAQYGERAVEPPPPKECPASPGALLEIQFEVSQKDRKTGKLRTYHVARCPTDGEYWVFEYGRGWSRPTVDQQRAIDDYYAGE